MTGYSTSNTMFDYIVVGTGPGGATLAKKLTDDKQSSLLLLEAGENNSSDRPVRDSLFAPPFILTDDFFPNYFWQGKGIPQPNVHQRSFQWTGGRLLGGGSSINNEQYVRPTPANMKLWENELGPMWSPEREISQFKQLENYNGVTYNAEARGYHGRLDIRQAPANPTKMAKKFVSAMENATGHAEILDYNDPNTPIGPFLRWQLYQTPTGTRESADTAFLSSDIMSKDGHGVNGRQLQASFESSATRILFDDNKRAIGVEYVKRGQCYQAFAKKIIISAGINTPKLLMLSGIGPENTLKQAGIPIIYANENVGQNLTTHSVNTATFTTNSNDRALPENDPYALYTAGAFLPNPTLGSNQNRRDVQLIGQITDKGMLTIVFFLLEPKSRGQLTIQSGDPLKVVLADPGFINHPDDLTSLKNIYKIYIKKIAAELAKIDPHYKLTKPSLETIEDDEKLVQFIKDNLSPTHHIQGTARMAKNESTGVVNAKGEVFGVKNLLIADDSIAPFPSDGNTSAPAFFIGANIADQLLH